MDRDQTRAAEKAISNTAVVAGAAVGGIAALCAELRDAGHLDADAVERIEAVVLAELGNMPDVTSRSGMQTAVRKAFAPAKT